MGTYFILLHNRVLGPIPAADAAGLPAFTLETLVKAPGAPATGWVPAGKVAELAAAYNALHSTDGAPVPGAPEQPVPSQAPKAGRDTEEAPESFADSLLDWESEKDLLLAGWKKEIEALKTALSRIKAAADGTAGCLVERRKPGAGPAWEERGPAATIAAEFGQGLEGEIQQLHSDFRKRIEKESADRLKKFAELIDTDLEAGRCVVLDELKPVWDKLSAAMTATLNAGLHEFEVKKQEALDSEIRRFRTALVGELDAAMAEVDRTAKEGTAALRTRMDVESKKFAAAGEGLRRALEQTWTEAARALDGHGDSLRDELARESRTLAAARASQEEKLKQAAGEISAQAAELGAKLALEMKKISAAREASLREFEAITGELRARMQIEAEKMRAPAEALVSGANAAAARMNRLAAAELEKKLAGFDLGTVYAEIRGRIEREAAQTIGKFSELAAAQLEAALAGVRKELDGQAAKALLLGGETRKKIEEAAADFFAGTSEMKRRVERAGAEAGRSLEAGKAAESEAAELRARCRAESEKLANTSDSLKRRLEQAAADVAKAMGAQSVSLREQMVLEARKFMAARESMEAELKKAGEELSARASELNGKLAQAAKPGQRTSAAGRLALRAVLVLAAAAVVFAGKTFFGARASYFKAYPAPSPNISVLLWHEGELWAGDWLEGTIYRCLPSKDGLELRKKYSIAGVHISGFAIAEGKLYIADSWKKTIEERALDDGLTLIKSVGFPEGISSLYYDGEYIWSCGPSGNVQQLKPGAGLAVAASFKTANRPDQIYKGKDGLWTAVSSAGRLYRHDPDGKLSIAGAYVLKPPLGKQPLSAFTWKDGKLWLAGDGTSELYEVGGGSLEKVYP